MPDGAAAHHFIDAAIEVAGGNALSLPTKVRYSITCHFG